MKNIAKYKIIIKSGRIVDDFPNKLRRLHRTKWKRILKYYKRKKNKFKRRLRRPRNRYTILNFSWFYRRRFSRKWRRRFPRRFINFFIGTIRVKSRKHRFVKTQTYLLDSLRQKLRLEQFYGENFFLKIDSRKHQSLSVAELTNLVAGGQFYRLNILLWKLRFFSSVAEASQYINNNYVLVNQTSVKPNYLLNLGDVIKFKKNFVPNHRKMLLKYKMPPKQYPFIEVDYYSGSVVIIKKVDDFVKEDYANIFVTAVPVRSIFNYLKK